MKQKLLLALFLVAGCAWQLSAQFTPQGFNYQSVVRNADGDALANQTVTLLFTIRSGAPNGTIAYAEKQTISTNEFGLINLIIGQGGQPQFGDFAGINWGGGSKFLTVSIETTPGTFSDLGASQLMSVPYALYAQSSGNSNPPGDNWGSQNVQTAPALGGNGTVGNPLTIAQQGAQNGQVLKWDGTKWIPQNDIADNFPGTVTQINTGVGLSGGPITGSGTIALTSTGITPGFYGSATQIPVLKIDAQGRITEVNFATPQPGTVTINGAAGINVQQNGFVFTVTNTGDTNPNDDLSTTTQAGGDLSGTFPNLQIDPNSVGSAEIAANAVGNIELADNVVSTNKIINGAVTAAKIDDMGANNGQVIKWNGTTWAPSADVSGITSVGLTGGAGINVSGASPNFTITNTGDPNPNDDLTTSTQASGDVSGPFTNLQIDPNVIGSAEIINGGVGTVDLADLAVNSAKLADNAVGTAKVANGAITAAKLDDMGATNGQVIKWNGTVWAPAADNAGSGTVSINAGPGIDVDGTSPNFTINNIGDTNPNDDVNITDLASGDISGSFNNLQIDPNTVGSTEIDANAVGTSELADDAVTAAKIDDMNATNGQVLKWNGNNWAPAADQTGGTGTVTITAGPGIDVDGTSPNFTINNTGDTNPNDDLNTTDQAGGDLSGPFSNLQLDANAVGSPEIANNAVGNSELADDAVNTNELADNAVTAAKIDDMNADDGQVLKFIGGNWTPADDETGGGGGGGDDWGNQVVKTDITLDGDGTNGSLLRIAEQGATNGQVLKFIGGNWTPADDETGGGGGGDDWGDQVVITGLTLDGDGTNGSPLDLAEQGATDGQVLKFIGGNWVPAADATGSGGNGDTYAAGVGISITGTAPNFLINNTGDTNPNDDLTDTDQANGDVTGPFSDLQIKPDAVGSPEIANNAVNTTELANNAVTTPKLNNGAVTAIKIDDMGANNGEVLKYNGTTWGPEPDLNDGNNYTAGAGISITGTAPNFTITNTGDADNNPTNELQTLSLNGSTLKISGTNSQVKFDTLLSAAGLDLWKSAGNNIYNGNSGNVGVGTMTPAAKLHVKGNGQSLRIEGSNPSIGLANGPGAADAYLSHGASGLVLGTADSSGLILRTGSNDAVIIEGGSGHVGMGGTNNGANTRLKLYSEKACLALENINSGDNWEFWVDGSDGSLELYNNSSGGFPAGTFATNGIYTPSDRRLKRDVLGLPTVLDKMLRLQAVSYHYKQERPGTQTSIGFLAQDVQSLFPELVGRTSSRDGQTGYLSLNYAGFSVLTVKAIQEQQEQIDQLKRENEALRQRTEDLEARMLRVEKLLPKD